MKLEECVYTVAGIVAYMYNQKLEASSIGQKKRSASIGGLKRHDMVRKAQIFASQPDGTAFNSSRNDLS